jgi:ribokinase
MPPSIAVVGSLNLDTVVQVARLPQPGETLLASGHFANPGGKGGNQAVAAARLGAEVAMIGRIGDDAAGTFLRDSLEADGVDASQVTEDSEAPTGVAFITVDAGGENSIVVSAGANAELSTGQIEAAADAVETAAVVLAQLEVPPESVLFAARIASGTVVLNPAPARNLDPVLLEQVDVLVPNETELAALTGSSGSESLGDIAAKARTIPGPKTVVVTLGARGALVVDDDEAVHVPAPRVQALDTTAAGDAFCGALGEALVRKATLVEAATWAVRAGAITTTRLGAQQSLPTRSEMEEL